MLSKLKKNDYVVGPFSKSTDPSIVECIGMAGFDFIIIDLEHGLNTNESALNLVRAALLHGITPIIRVSQNNESLISKALETGAMGVQVPQVSSKQDALKVVNAAKFSPLGNRGVCRYVRAAGYSSKEKNSYFEEANSTTVIIIQIEGERGIDNIDEILDVEGVDVIFLGPYDLSQSLGVPGQVNHPKVICAMEKVLEKAASKNKAVGTFVENPKDLKIWRDLGILYLAYKVDVGIFYEACLEINDQLR